VHSITTTPADNEQLSQLLPTSTYQFVLRSQESVSGASRSRRHHLRLPSSWCGCGRYHCSVFNNRQVNQP